MIDPFCRKISYLRLSVTDRCDLRCVYCMAEDMEFLPKAELLTLEELQRLCEVFIRKGIQKIRLTGGEPLVRRGIMTLVESLGQAVRDGRLEELTLTTNGTQLTRFAEGLAAAGVRRVNVSLDSLRPERFRALTRRGDFAQVIDGIMAAKAAGLSIKINTVALKGGNDDEVDDLVAWCGEHGFDLTFIETMPMGDVHADRTEQFLPLSELRQRLERRWRLAPSEYRTGGPARYATVAETGRRIGFITPMTHNFCESCNRIRVTCTGTLYPCLGQEEATELAPALRSGPADEALEAAIDRAIGRKPKGHDFVIDRETRPTVSRHMSVTGG